jgi:hypothetical protein
LSSFPAPAGDEDAEPTTHAAKDTDVCPPRFHSILPPARDGVPDTVRAPRPSSLPALAFAAGIEPIRNSNRR